MSCNCGSCAACKTTLNDFAETTTLADASYFVLANRKKASLKTLRDNLLPTVPVSDLSLLPDGTLLMVEAGEIVASSMVEGADTIESSKDLSLPGDSLKFGNSVALHNIAQQLGITSGDVEYFINQYKVDDTQSYRPKWVNLGAQSTTNLQTTDTTDISGTTISFQIPLSGSATAWKINAMRLRGNAAVTGVRIIVSVGSAPLLDNSNVIYEWPQADQWADGEGYSFSAGDFSIDTKPLLLDSDGVYYVTFKVPVGSGTLIDLKGDGSNVPYLRIDAQSGSIEDIITESALGTYVTGPASATNNQIPIFNGNTGKAIKESTYNESRLFTSFAQGNISASALLTTFAAPDVAVKVNYGAAFVADIQDNATVAADGRFQATLTGPHKYFVQFDITADVAGGTPRIYRYYITKNGTTVSSSEQAARYSGSSQDGSAVASIVTLESGDYIELWVAPVGHTTSINVIGTSAKWFKID